MKSRSKPGNAVVIIGGGHIGQLSLLAIKAAGARPGYVTIDKLRLDKPGNWARTLPLNADEGDINKAHHGNHEVGADVLLSAHAGAIYSNNHSAARRQGTIVDHRFSQTAMNRPDVYTE